MDVSIIEILTIAMFFISFYGLITSKNIVKSIVFIAIMETSVIMFFLSIGFRSGMLPPVGLIENAEYIADPLPQALMITAIVVGLSSTAVNIIMFITLFRTYKTADWDLIKKFNNAG